MPERIVSLRDVIGQGYDEFWNFEGRYRYCIGSRMSKKSCTTALNIIYRMMKQPLSNTLCVRRYFTTHRNSCYSQLKWAIDRLGVGDYWKATVNPLEITYKPTGQKILFRGLDDPQSITSITVEHGYLNFVWIEEASQIEDSKAFDKLDLSIRGELPKGYFKQVTITQNPWSASHFLKERFWDRYEKGDNMKGNLLCLRTTYKQNEWLDEQDLQIFEDMKVNEPKRYAIEGEAQWGIAEGNVYENWDVINFDIQNLIAQIDKPEIINGLDFGYSNDPTAFIRAIVDNKKKKIFIIDEIYEYNKTNEEIAELLKNKGYESERIIADSAEPKSIRELKDKGILRVKPSRKGSDSINHGIQLIQQYHILVHPHCKNTIEELQNYIWETGDDGKPVNKPIDKFNHAMDALRYAMQAQSNRRTGFAVDEARDYYGQYIF